MTLGSKSTWGFKQTSWPFVDENTKLRMEEGPEYKVPHFYADYDLIKEFNGCRVKVPIKCQKHGVFQKKLR